MSDIVSEICEIALARIPMICAEFQEKLDYVYNLQMNPADALEKRFGIVPLGREPISGSSGFKRRDHEFQIILTEEVDNQDCDTDMRNKIKSLYPCMDAICKDFMKNCFEITTPGTQIIQVKEGPIDIPEILGENDGVALRMNMVFQYQTKN